MNWLAWAALTWLAVAVLGTAAFAYILCRDSSNRQEVKQVPEPQTQPLVRQRPVLGEVHTAYRRRGPRHVSDETVAIPVIDTWA